MEELQQLLALVGAGSFAEACTAISSMNAALASAQTALGTQGAMATMTALSGRSATLAAVEKATGKQGDEALGVVRAALSALAELPKLQEEVAKLKKDGEVHELDRLFSKAKSERRWTPALESSVRASFAAGEVTLKGVETWLANSPMTAVGATHKAPAPADAPTAAPVAMTHEGKTWEQLSGSERAALKKSHPEIYQAMREAAMASAKR